MEVGGFFVFGFLVFLVKDVVMGGVSFKMMRYYREFLSNSMIQFVLFVGTVSSILTIVEFDGVKTILALLAGAVLYAVVEYLVHRYLLHQFPNAIPVLYQKHVEHHQYPTALRYLFSPMWYDLIVYVVYFVVLWAVFRNLSLVMAFIAGTSLYQLYYQWMHYIAHRPITPVTPWGKWMKKKHLLHHYMDEQSWYGVSHPVMDYLMGTHNPKSSKTNGYMDGGK
jgi:4-hydroxysphinganine ceramide fatty acyl 2-hydroxylase